MPEPILPAAVRLSAAVETLAALAAHARVRSEGLEVDPEVARLLEAIATEVLGSPDLAPTDSGPQAIGMARALLREATALVDDPGRAREWSTPDEAVLQGLGRLSMAIAPVFAHAASTLPGLRDALSSPSAAFLDVGTGTGWLAVATARMFPEAKVVGIDVFEPALALARRNVMSEGLRDRISVRMADVCALEDDGAFDAVWLPLPFLSEAIVPRAIERAARALRPGGWLLPGTFAGPDDSLSQMLTDLRVLRCGGRPWTPAETVGMLRAAGLTSVTEIRRTWAAPVRLFAAQRAG